MVKELQKAKQDVPSKLLVPIPDPEKIWLKKQEIIRQLYNQKQEEDEEEVTFITNTISDPSLLQQQQDYIAFPSDDSDTSDSEESEESEGYDLDKDYSWFSRFRRG
jgi:hypothetical protein